MVVGFLCPGSEEITSETMHSDDVKVKQFGSGSCFGWRQRYGMQTKAVSTFEEVLEEGKNTISVLQSIIRVSLSILSNTEPLAVVTLTSSLVDDR